MSRYDLSREELGGLMEGQPRYRVDQVWAWLYGRGAELAEMTDLPVALRQRLAEAPALGHALTPETERKADAGLTRKWVWSLHDGARVETVLMHYPSRSTVCVSSQAGCAMGCGFCATGQGGFGRNLSTGEIVEQVVRAARACRETGRRLSNVVFMGMGEPLANYPRVWAAVERIHHDVGLSARHLTISTVGLVPGIRRLAGAGLAVGLAVSLHAANDALRDRLVPINRRWPIAQLMEACRAWTEATGRRLSLEWALMDQVNDSPADAAQLAALARPLGAHVNLIPLNPTPAWERRGANAGTVASFARQLEALAVTVTVRQTRGTAIDAACGQLAGTGAAASRAGPSAPGGAGLPD